MTPKSNARTSTTSAPTAALKKSPGASSDKEIIRDDIFTRFDNPFGLKQHVWNSVLVGTSHILGLYFVYRLFTLQCAWNSAYLLQVPYGYLGGLGITVGCHRYWTHKTFKANLPLQIILMCMQTIAMQYPIYKWTLDHRIHHKYTDTDADPHNSKRGFWFSHMTWVFQPKRKELEQKLKTFEMPDLENDPVVRFQSRWFWTLSIIFHLIIPIYVLRSIGDVSVLDCVLSCSLRYVLSLHFTWFVNSIAHIWGDKPYDKNVTAVDNSFVSLLAVGEGWHNYHHTFPWDYKAAELGWKVNMSTIFIDFFAWIGWAWDLKTVSSKMLNERLQRTGDGSRVKNENGTTKGKINSHDQLFWGWDDETIPNDLRSLTTIIQPENKKR